MRERETSHTDSVCVYLQSEEDVFIILNNKIGEHLKHIKRSTEKLSLSAAWLSCDVCVHEPASGQKLTPMSYISLSGAKLANRLLFRLFARLSA